jgi:hypothetical protein
VIHGVEPLSARWVVGLGRAFLVARGLSAPYALQPRAALGLTGRTVSPERPHVQLSSSSLNALAYSPDNG